MWACDSKNETKPPASDNFDSQGGGAGGGGDDDAADDDDENDDDDDTTIPTVPTIVAVYGNNSQNSQYTSFFTAYGIEATFVNEGNLSTFDFTGYASILVTETCEFYNTTGVQAIEASGLNVLGVFQGGAILFGKMGLYADLGSGYGYEVEKIVGLNDNFQLWSKPYAVSMTTGGVITISSLPISGWGHSNVGTPANFVTFAEIWGTTSRAILSMQSNKYFFWGLHFNTSYYTVDAAKLLANAIYYVSSS